MQNKIEKFLSEKTKQTYSFTITSQDGESIKKTNNLQEFANEWMNGKLKEGRMVTDFGDVIYRLIITDQT
jgi:hypothetical protein